MIVRTQKLKILVILGDSKDFRIEQYFPEFHYIPSSLSHVILDNQLLINKDAPHKLLKIRWLKYAVNESGQPNSQHTK